MSVHGLTSADVEFIRRLRRDLDALPVISSRSDQFEELGQTPDVHVVRTPSGGIAPTLQYANPAGTGTGTGTLAAAEDLQNLPGSASCTVYRVEMQGANADTPEWNSTGDTLTVYNQTGGKIDGDSFLAVTRSKYGDWVAGAQSRGCAIVRTGSAGIPALSQGATTGTGSQNVLDDAPGSASCAVYRISGGLLVPAGVYVTVYNLMTVAVPSYHLLLAHRDDGGVWVVAPLPLETEDC